MTTFIITLLIISQIMSFNLIFKRLKPKVIKPDGFFLKPIPKDIEYEDIDQNHDLIYEVLETIKLENWKYEIDIDTTYSTWRLQFSSNDSKTTVRSRITEYSKKMDLSMFHIVGPKGLVSISKEESKITNDVILFLWDYVIKEYEDRNKIDKQRITNSIEGIRDSLKTLKRSNRLNSILNG